MKQSEFDAVVAKLGFKKLAEESKRPMTNPYNPEELLVKLATYVHPNRQNRKLKVYFSEGKVIAVWNDVGKRQLTAWKPVTPQNIHVEFGITP